MEASVYLRTIETWANLGWVHYLIGNFDEASAQFEKSIKMQDVSNNPALYFINNYRLAWTHLAFDDLQQAMKHAETTLEIAENNDEQVYLGFRGNGKILYGLLLAKLDSAQFDEAENLMLDGVKTLEKLAVKPDIARAYSSLGDLYTTIGKKEEAIKYLLDAETLFREMKMDFCLGQMLEISYQLHRKEGDTSTAKEHLTTAIDIMKELEAFGWVERYEEKMERV